MVKSFGWILALCTASSAATPTAQSDRQLLLDQQLSDLDLVSYQGVQSSSYGLLSTATGKTYAVSDMRPYTELFAPQSFTLSDDGMVATHKVSGQTIPVSVYRMEDTDQTIVQVFKDELGKVVYGEVRSKDEQDTYFVPADIGLGSLVDSGADGNDTEDVLMSFTSSDIDREKLAENFDLGDVAPPIAEQGHFLSLNSTWEGPVDGGDRRSLATGQCESFQVIPVALVYDSALCGVYGSKRRTESRLMTIAASASALYERDMCIKLQLTDIYTPDNQCGGTSATFKNFFFDRACGESPSLLDDFTAWTRSERTSRGLDADALIHLFTGAPRPTSSRTIGCAWIGVVSPGTHYPLSFLTLSLFQLCLKNWSTGVEYLTFSSSVVSQTLVFAHEVGHNLNAQHMADSNKQFNYIMEASISTGADGFSSSSISTMRSFLNRPSVNCDYKITASPPSTPRPTPRPTRRPTPRPTRRPTPRPTRRPTPRPTRRPVPSPVRPPPTVAPDASVCPVPVEMSLCLVKPAIERFSCFPLDELLPAPCPELGITFEITRCNKLAVNRRLKKQKTQDTKNEEGDEGASVQVSSSAFQAPDCSASCIAVDDQLCFNGLTGNHFFTFFAIDEQGNRVGNLNRRRVAGYSRDLGGCRSATIQCQE